MVRTLLSLAQSGIPHLRHDAFEVGLDAFAFLGRPRSRVRPQLANLLQHVVDQGAEERVVPAIRSPVSP